MRALVLSITAVLAAKPLPGDTLPAGRAFGAGVGGEMAEQGGPVLSHVAQGRDGGRVRFDI